MDPKFTEVSQVFERFKAAFVRKDFDTCEKLLSQLKVHLNSSKLLHFFLLLKSDVIIYSLLGVMFVLYSSWSIVVLIKSAG